MPLFIGSPPIKIGQKIMGWYLYQRKKYESLAEDNISILLAFV